ncbi:MAG: glycosyl hydrolase family 88 [Butyrivibrio sp.]|jgi:unsaturated chondroitin disaccharide hydrolase|nr:glycosyl hydrolase family 88 [Butyrivibrio sp.]
MSLAGEYSEWAATELDKVKNKIKWVAENNKNKIPYTTDEKGIYDNKADNNKEYRIDDGINWWTNGFWAGILWLLYNDTKESRYKEYAMIQEDLMRPAFDMFYGLHHDVGFMFVPSAVADYRLTGNNESRRIALHAANLLAGRFNAKGAYIRAWNDLEDADTRGWAIIDCMFNISLLFWASEETKDPRYRHIATAHADTVSKAFIRENGSVCHIVEFDPVTGTRLKSYAGQGFAHGSSWTRGQGWALYGFTSAYRHTKDDNYLQVAEKVADYCISRIGRDYIIPIDFDQPAECKLEDSCGACVIAGGLIDLADEVSDISKSKNYLKTAVGILKQIADNRADYTEKCEAIVQNCSAAFHAPKHHFTMVYADYYYIEALYKLAGSDFKIW